MFSLKGVFSIVLQVLNLGWQGIRTIGAKVIGEPVMKVIETGVEVVQIIRKDGIAGLWEYLKDQFQDLKTMVMDAVMDLIQTQVIQAGIKWILGLLSPVSAFIKAAMAIVDVVKFFIQRAAQIGELVSAFTDSIAAIAAGKVGAVAKAIENALGKAVPVLIGLLASILGIGGLANKVLGIIRKVRLRVVTAITNFWLKVKKGAKKLLRRFKRGKKKGKPEKEPQNDNTKKGNEEVGELVEFKAGKEKHELWYNEKDDHLWVASEDPKPIEDRLSEWESKIKNDDSEEANEKKRLIVSVRKKVKKTQLEAATLEKIITNNAKSPAKKDNPKDKEIKKENDAISEMQKIISVELTQLFVLFGEEDQIGSHVPDVGEHPMKKEKKALGKGGGFRESHHVAEFALMKQTEEFYKSVQKSLEGENGKPIDPVFTSLYDGISDRLKHTKDKFGKDRGNGLPAILLHASSHRLAAAAVHGKGNIIQKYQAVLEEIGSQKGDDKAKSNFIIYTAEGDLGVSFRKNQWDAMLATAYFFEEKAKSGDYALQATENKTQLDKKFLNLFEIKKDEDKGEIIVKISGKKGALDLIKEDIANKINEIKNGNNDIGQTSDKYEKLNSDLSESVNTVPREVYNSALNFGIAAVTTALKNSDVDGDNNKHGKEIVKISAKSQKIWKTIIGKVT